MGPLNASAARRNKLSFDAVLVGESSSRDMEQLQQFTPGSTLGYMQGKTAEQVEGVHSIADNFVHETNIVLKSSF